MTIFSKMRITHKISALMIGLATGFIAIGVTYYIQINISQTTQVAEKDAFIYLQKLNELKQLEVELRYEAANTNAINNMQAYDNVEQQLLTKIEELREQKLSRNFSPQIASIEDDIKSFQSLVENRISTENALGDIATAGPMSRLNSYSEEVGNIVSNSGNETTIDRFTQFKMSLLSFFSSPSQETMKAIETHLGELSESIASDKKLSLSDSERQQMLSRLTSLFTQTTNFAEQYLAADTALTNHQNALNQKVNNLLQISGDHWLAQLDVASDKSKATQASVTAIIFVVAMGTAVGIYLIYKSIVFPMAHMQNVIRRINRGKLNARVKIIADDELGDLGRAFNTLFDERIQQLESQSKENDRLNNSIISLIQALGTIARKDLTVKVPVSSDITGTISDAVNLLTSETASTLREVNNISQEVNQVSDNLQEQSQLVMQIAESERRQILATAKALKMLATAMTDVAMHSEQADKSATQAIRSTQSAKHTVLETVEGIRTIRETISETEKRMKRLGDRSQEVSGIVNLINTIAERTHILALNASMHAASAGEAGKGFAVVAEEVQRLAESARQSTDEISSMVNNMRVETSDTVTIMNTLISQVAEGSRLAEQAGKQMDITETATKELVETVKRIASESVQQAAVANKVKDRATLIKNFSDKTEKQLQQQKRFTDALRHCATTLVEQVSVFRLPEGKEPVKPLIHTIEPDIDEEFDGLIDEEDTPMSSVG
ncbi:Methyl-accepting chemotaxis protein McpB [Thalassocella blandensis]|nr:Methyl-accepting chemotaxis protein McpB [Thalassocella blandensis]